MGTTTFPSIERSKLYTYLYDWDIELLSSENKDINVKPIKILGINKESAYMQNFLPVLLLKLRIRKIDIFKLKDNEKDIIASVNIKFKKYNVSNEGGHLSLLETGLICSATYTTAFSKDSFATYLRRDEVEHKSTEDKEGFQTNMLESDYVTVSVSLTDIVGINASKQLYNEVFSGSKTVSTMMAFIASNSHCKKILMDVPDNENEYEQDIILPPLSLVAAFKYVQNVLGCYENGLTTFYDDDVLYILDRFGDDHDVEKGETNLVHVYVSDPDKGVVEPVYSIDDEGNSLYIGTFPFSPNNSKIMKNEITGDNFIFSSFRQGLDAMAFDKDKFSQANSVAMVLKHNTDSHSQSGEKSILDYDELNNPFNMASDFNMIESMAEIANIVIKNVNITDFKPNKYLHLHFRDQRKEFDYGGKWHILSVTQMYVPSGMQPDRTEVQAAMDEGKNLESMVCAASVVISRRKNI